MHGGTLPLRLRGLVAVALLVATAPGLAEQFTGRVVGVSDGDTVTVLRQTAQGPRPARIRLHGIDCPESRQAFGTRAKQFTSAAAFGKQATVDVKDTDRYGRLVAVVTVEGRNLNRELVKAGLAWWYRQYAPQDRDLAALEAEARAAHRGLWADPWPVPPWEFRHGPAPSSGTSATSQTPDQDRAAVYVTPRGRRYHRAGCRYLNVGQKALPPKDARAQGYTPCLVCKP